MPTYEYTCTECGEQVEVVQKFTDDPLTVCTACGGRLRKVFSPVGIVFKGSGFYRTDSRNEHGAGDGQGKDGRARTARARRTRSRRAPSRIRSPRTRGSSGLLRLGFLGLVVVLVEVVLVRLGLVRLQLVGLRLVLVRVLLRVRRQEGHQEFGVGRLVLSRWLTSSG